MNFLLKMTLIAFFGVAIFGCSEKPKGKAHTGYAPDGHPVYTIARKGGVLRDENFDVVLVYGFNDNREIAYIGVKPRFS